MQTFRDHVVIRSDRVSLVQRTLSCATSFGLYACTLSNNKALMMIFASRSVHLLPECRELVLIHAYIGKSQGMKVSQAVKQISME